MKVVCVADLNMMEQMFKKDEFSDRINYKTNPITHFAKLMRGQIDCKFYPEMENGPY